MRRLVATLVGTLLALTVLTLPSPAHAVQQWGYQNQAVAATKAQRAAYHRPQVRVDACLKRFAVRHAQRMASERRMFHQDLQPILRQCRLSRVGENVAYGYRDGRDVVNRGWMNSPSHKVNLLDRRYRLVAVGARRASNGQWYVSQLLGRR